MLAAILLVFEMTLPGVVFLFLAIGAAASGALLAVAPGTSLEAQLGVFAVFAVASALALRPTLKRLQGRVAASTLNARGEALVKSGGGKTAPCGVCHGLQLKGLGETPPIAGFSPLYVYRQLHGVQTGARGGPSAGMMQSVVGRLDENDMIAIVAYLGTLAP